MTDTGPWSFGKNCLKVAQDQTAWENAGQRPRDTQILSAGVWRQQAREGSHRSVLCNRSLRS